VSSASRQCLLAARATGRFAGAPGSWQDELDAGVGQVLDSVSHTVAAPPPNKS
jgi:hypothetical protein